MDSMGNLYAGNDVPEEDAERAKAHFAKLAEKIEASASEPGLNVPSLVMHPDDYKRLAGLL